MDRGRSDRIVATVDEVFNRVTTNFDALYTGFSGEIVEDVGNLHDDDTVLLPSVEEDLEQGLRETDCFETT